MRVFGIESNGELTKSQLNYKSLKAAKFDAFKCLILN